MKRLRCQAFKKNKKKRKNLLTKKGSCCIIPHVACRTLQLIRYRGVAQSGSARALGAWGRGFESLHPDIPDTLPYYGPVVKWPKTPPFHGGYSGSNPDGVTTFSFGDGPLAQLVRAPACHAGGRGFEPHPGRTFLQLQALPLVDCAGVAQSVEQLICNQQVAGSSPIASSIP